MTNNQNILTRQSAVNNLAVNIAGVSIAGLMLTASIALTYLTYGENGIAQADTAIRKELVKRFEKASEAGQPSDKARGYWKAGKRAFTDYMDSLQTLADASDDIEQATTSICLWLEEKFTLGKNHYLGGAYLAPLTMGKSKKEVRELVAARKEGNVSETKEGKEATSRKGNIAVNAGTKKALQPVMVEEAAFTAEGALQGLIEYYKAKPSKDVSAEFVSFAYAIEQVGKLVGNPEAIGHFKPKEKKLAKLIRAHIDIAPFAKFKEVEAKEAA